MDSATTKKRRWPVKEHYRKRCRLTRVVGPHVDAAERYAKKLGETFTEFVTEAVRQRLERDGILPPKS